jgi:hypothetical protein
VVEMKNWVARMVGQSRGKAAFYRAGV